MSGPSLDLGLVLNVLFEYREGGPAHSEQAVCATPEYWFPVVFFNVIGELFPYQARSDRL